MTKKEEVDLLRETADRLGPDSYVGPALIELLPLVWHDIRSDFQPDLLGHLKRMEQQADDKAREVADLEVKLQDINTKIAQGEATLRHINDQLDKVKDQARDAMAHLGGLITNKGGQPLQLV